LTKWESRAGRIILEASSQFSNWGLFFFVLFFFFFFFFFFFCNIDNDFQNYLHKMNTIMKEEEKYIGLKTTQSGVILVLYIYKILEEKFSKM
jgi:hypothetical protein